MRLATWNVEWFSILFDMNDRLLADDAPSRRHGVSRAAQADGIAYVLERLDADLVTIIEAPDTGTTRSTVRALEGFAAAYGLRQRKAMIGFPNGTEQEIAALYDPDVLTPRHDPMEDPRAPRFDRRFHWDTDIDGQPEQHVFSKPPLELEITGPALPEPLRLIAVHLKSKAPLNGATPAEAEAHAIANRRKQMAQALWLRRRIDALLDAGRPVAVTGDFNDGPGLDHFEELFGRSSAEVVIGTSRDPNRRLRNPHAEATLNPQQGFTLATARFYHRDFQAYVGALIDYVLLSPDLVAAHRPRWRIWHPFDEPRIYADPGLRDALLAASDHFPVSVELG